MSLLDLDRSSDEQQPAELLATISSLFSAGVVAWVVSALPPGNSLSFVGLIVFVALRLLLVAFTSAAFAWLVLRRNPPIANRLALEMTIFAVWLVPLALLIRQHSVWVLLPAAVFAANASRAINLLARSEDSLEASSAKPFAPLPSSKWSWRQPTAIAAGLIAQVGVLLSFGGHSFSAALLVAASTAVWAISYWRAVPDSSGPSNSETRSILVAAAILCTFATLATCLRLPLGSGGLGLSRGAPRPGAVRARTRQGGTELPRGDSSTGAADGHAGIILLAPAQTVTELVAPPAIDPTEKSRGRRTPDPLVIPFGGVYWFYKAPDSSPPKTSRQAHGTPELFDIRSTDRSPLSMEAHQNLGSLINLDGCGKIQVAITNRDHYPETVALELILTNSTLRGKPSQSLGRAPVRSTQAWQIYDDPSPRNETLSFAIPVRGTIRRFDEVTIVFHLDHARSDYGAKISIDRLVLIPRGM